MIIIFFIIIIIIIIVVGGGGGGFVVFVVVINLFVSLHLFMYSILEALVGCMYMWCLILYTRI